MRLSEQPVPEETRCPSCGDKPTEDSVVEHRLSDMGYLHDDIRLECQSCDERWTLGVPVGEELEYGDDLWCDSCDDSVMLIHRLRVQENGVAILDLKCPNCYYFDAVKRHGKDHDYDGTVYLSGYPGITGSFDGAEEYGYE